ncbi:MAG: UvrD-helicase domain-containing protein [bacterium]|nr:UvrD-helicase domain-containing protein [bacterium]
MEDKKLNTEQLEAAKHKNGPLLIIAGAGTGKTTVVTERIKYLIAKELAKPSEILALTFTEKAAREMEERVDIAMPYGYTQMWISTFHAFCDRILRSESLNIGLSSRYNLMSQAETIQYLRKYFFEFELDYFRPLGNPHKFIEGMVGHFSRLKDEDISPVEYFEYAQKLADKKEMSEEDGEEAKKTMELAKAHQTYENIKARDGVMDFSDLIAQTLRLFRTRKNILRQYQRQFKYILIDEFQDTNFAQYALVKLLAPPESKPNLTVVGDDSQSIYKFRGAAISNILQFMKDYSGAKQVVLTTNYRSTQTILDHSYRLIKHNDPDTLEAQLGIIKNLKASRVAQEEPVEFLYLDRVENEAEEVAKTISKLKSQKISLKYSDFAILVRANNHAEPFMRALGRTGIPYQFLGPGALFKQPEVKDLISYLKVLVNFEDSVSMYKVLANDLLDINSRDLAAITNFARRQNLSLFEACEQQEKISLTHNGREKIEKLIGIVHRHLGLVPKESAGQILYYFLDEMGFLSKLIDSQTASAQRKVQNLSKFFDRIKSYEVEHEDASVFTISDWIDLSMELGESPLSVDIDWTEIDAVNLLTVHSAKGLEFPIVFLTNLVSQRFPTIERKEKIPVPDALIKEILPIGDYHLEEERRLFYVGMTRAKDRLYLTAADYYGEGKREKKISPFVIEALGAEVVIKKPKDATDIQLTLLSWPKTQEIPIEANAPQTPTNYLSYSQIETFKTCPFHYKLRYLLNIPTPPSPALSFGASIHAVLKDFYQLKILGNKLGEEKLLELLERNWVKEGYYSKNHEKLSFTKGKKLLSDLYKNMIKNEKTMPLTVEQTFSFPIRGLRVGGRIDRVNSLDNKIEIVDYKTGATMPTQRDIDRNLQMTIYALAATEVREKPFDKKPDEVVLSFYFLEKGKKVNTVRTGAQLELAKKELLAWQQKISTSDFKCNHSEMCKYCEYKLLCDPY